MAIGKNIKFWREISGLKQSELAERLGHADSAVTKNVYLHITEKMVQKDNEAYERMIL